MDHHHQVSNARSRIVAIQQEKNDTRVNTLTGRVTDTYTSSLTTTASSGHPHSREQYLLRVKETYRRYMTLYGYDEEAEREYDDEEDVREHMIEVLLARLDRVSPPSETYVVSQSVVNPLERVLINDLRTFWNLYKGE